MMHSRRKQMAAAALNFLKQHELEDCDGNVVDAGHAEFRLNIQGSEEITKRTKDGHGDPGRVKYEEIPHVNPGPHVLGYDTNVVQAGCPEFEHPIESLGKMDEWTILDNENMQCSIDITHIASKILTFRVIQWKH